ncbi:hypothetical protein BGX29_003615, partial [Mortierella sp. GBA35]
MAPSCSKAATAKFYYLSSIQGPALIVNDNGAGHVSREIASRGSDRINGFNAFQQHDQ